MNDTDHNRSQGLIYYFIGPMDLSFVEQILQLKVLDIGR